MDACEICLSSGHPTDLCPTFLVDTNEEVEAVWGYSEPSDNYNPYSNTYYPGWWDPPNLSYGQQQVQALRQHEPSLEELIRQMATNNIQFQQETKAISDDLQNSLEQLATEFSKMSCLISGRLPSQPNEDVKKDPSAVTLHNGKMLDELTSPPQAIEEKEIESEEVSEEGENSKGPKVSILEPLPKVVERQYDELCDEFPDFISSNNYTHCNSCTDCDGDMICVICAEISAFLRADDSVCADTNVVEGSINNVFDAIAGSKIQGEIELQATEEFSVKGEEHQMMDTAEVDFVFGPCSNRNNVYEVDEVHILLFSGEAKEIKEGQWDPGGSPHAVSTITWSLRFNQWDPGGNPHASSLTWLLPFSQWDPGGSFHVISSINWLLCFRQWDPGGNLFIYLCYFN